AVAPGSRSQGPASAFARARFFVGDAGTAAPCVSGGQPLPWQQVVSVQFALHYFFSSEERAKQFLQNSIGRLCAGGLLILTTVDASRMAALAKQALASETLVAGNKLYRATFQDSQTAERVAAGANEFGLRYRFDLIGEGIDCEEWVVPEALLQKLLLDLDVELLASVPFGKLVPSGQREERRNPSAAEIAGNLLNRLGSDSKATKEAVGTYAIYDRLGVKLSRSEAEVVTLYKAYVGRRRGGKERPDLATAIAEATAAVAAGALNQEATLGDGDLLQHLPAVHLRQQHQ
ncbi:unnamed protein product, partial [Polarella glacialis]